jgi:hypothetical protein
MEPSFSMSAADIGAMASRLHGSTPRHGCMLLVIA